MTKQPNDEKYSTVPTIPTDYNLHNADTPFCYDPTCPDKEDPDLIGQVNQGYQDGLITAEDATNIINGRIV
jgi:hypothetical protein